MSTTDYKKAIAQAAFDALTRNELRGGDEQHERLLRATDTNSWRYLDRDKKAIEEFCND